jgi:hypothetical protein
MPEYLVSLRKFAKKASPLDPLYVQKVLHKCAYSVNSRGSSHSNERMLKRLNYFGRSLSPPIIFSDTIVTNDANKSVSKIKAAVLKLANTNAKNVKRDIYKFEEEACNISVRCQFNNKWEESGYNIVEFSSVNTKAYLLMKSSYYNQLLRSQTEHDLVARLINPPIAPAPNITAALPVLSEELHPTDEKMVTPKTRMKGHFITLFDSMEAQGIDIQLFMKQNVKPLLKERQHSSKIFPTSKKPVPQVSKMIPYSITPFSIFTVWW